MNLQRNILACLIVSAWTAFAAQPAAAQEAEAAIPPQLKWSFAGPFGKFDQAQLQRGFKIYREVCSACHSLSLLSFRNLSEPGGPGFTTAQAAAIAAEFTVPDGPNEQGEMFDRSGRPADHFPLPYRNEQDARARFNAVPPDMSVLAKARSYPRGFPRFIFDFFTQYQESGVDYIAALLKGYDNPPAGVTIPEGTLYNKYFPGHAIAMPQPLSNGQVTFDDGSPQTLDQYSRDVSAFLMWAAEPHLDARKRIGFQVMVFLVIFAGLLYLTKKKLWRDVKLHPEDLQADAPSQH
jgi:cytochrome c1